MAGSQLEAHPKDGQPHGHGKLTVKLPCGSNPPYVYEGDSAYGWREGQGRLELEYATYVGQFVKRRVEGHGTLTLARQQWESKLKEHVPARQLKGLFRDNMFTQQDPRKLDFWICTTLRHQYRGQLKDVKRHRKGWQIHFPDLAEYEGDFADDCQTGHGVLKKQGQEVFWGTWHRKSG